MAKSNILLDVKPWDDETGKTTRSYGKIDVVCQDERQLLPHVVPANHSRINMNGVVDWSLEIGWPRRWAVPPVAAQTQFLTRHTAERNCKNALVSHLMPFVLLLIHSVYVTLERHII